MHKIQLVIVSLLAIVVFLNTLPNKLVWDDHRFIEEWTEIRSLTNTPKFFAGSYAPRHDGKYRPLKGVILAIDYRLWGKNPLGYHVQAIAIHVAAVVIIYLIAFELLKKSGGAFITAALFALHPIHVEAITFITSSTDILGIVFMLLAFYFYVREFNPILTLIFATFGYLSNEIALVLFPLFIIHDLLFRNLRGKRSEFLVSYIPHGVLLMVYLFVRIFLLRISDDPGFYATSFPQTAFLMFKVIARYIYLLAWPVYLSVNHVLGRDLYAIKVDNNQNLAMSQIGGAGLLVSAVVVIALIIVAIWARKRWPIVAFCIVWFFVSLVPVLQLVPLPAFMTERYAYLASFGFCLFIGLALGKFLEKKPLKIVAICIFILLMGLYAYRTYLRNFDWKDGLTLWSVTVKQTPKSMFAHNNVGQAYWEAGETSIAIEHLKYAEEHNINNIAQVNLNLGKAYFKNDQLDPAFEQLNKSIDSNPVSFEAYYYVGQIYTKREETDLAIKNYQKSISLNPEFYDTYIALGVAYSQTGNLNQAIDIFKKAKGLSPKSVHAYNNLSVIYSKLGKIDLALEELRSALEIDPDNAQVKTNLERLEKYKSRH